MFARLWYDAKVRLTALQIAVLGLAAFGLAWLAHNTVANLSKRGIAIGFDFLDRPARFPISESLLAYTPTDSFGHAFLVGLVNTLFIAAIVILGSTVLGSIVGLARRSRHPMAFGLSTVFVEAMRNTPLVVQLLFWYSLVTVGLPAARAALSPVPGVFLSVRGLLIPRLELHGDLVLFGVTLLAALALIAAGFSVGRWRRIATGRSNRFGLAASAIAFAAIGFVWWLGGMSAVVNTPRLQGFNFIGGTALTPEFAALIVGLILYSSVFVGEIIRGGIDAVSLGQWEAGRSIGLSDGRILRLIVVPQALRVIIPPMTSQYLNIVKNTTLALVVGYPDIAFVAATTINQTGQAIEGILILMSVFLTISVTVSLFMNWYNRRIALVQR